MKKNNTHDYAISAFMMYARAGKPKSRKILEELKASRREYLAYTGSDKCLKIKARRMSGKTAAIRRVYLDVYAIEKALYSPENERDKLITKCVEAVYFPIAKYGNKQGKTSGLVLKCSLDLNLSVNSVNLYLSEACKRFCEERGLRTDGEEELIRN